MRLVTEAAAALIWDKGIFMTYQEYSDVTVYLTMFYAAIC